MKSASLILLLAVTLAVSCSRSAPEAISTRPRELANQSTAALAAKDYGNAQSLAGEATRLDPEFAEAWVAYGMASVRLGQTDQAREAYERALALHQKRLQQNPANPNEAFQQIFVLTLLGRADEAEVLLKRARADFPNDQQIARVALSFTTAKAEWKIWTVKQR